MIFDHLRRSELHNGGESNKRAPEYQKLINRVRKIGVGLEKEVNLLTLESHHDLNTLEWETRERFWNILMGRDGTKTERKNLAKDYLRYPLELSSISKISLSLSHNDSLRKIYNLLRELKDAFERYDQPNDHQSGWIQQNFLPQLREILYPPSPTKKVSDIPEIIDGILTQLESR